MSPHPTYIAVISDCPLLRRGLEHMFDAVPDLRRVTPVRPIEAGARGYLSQQVEETELLTAIRTVASGRSYFSTGFGSQRPHGRSLHITDRERQILELVASGATDREIASKLNISEHTVHSHLDRLGSKTGCRRRADLIRLALQQDPDDG